jgi:hypothetical protein
LPLAASRLEAEGAGILRADAVSSLQRKFVAVA